MKPHEIVVSGKITDSGKLSIYMGELNEFTAKWKGARVIARFTVSIPGTSKNLKAYYYNYIVPTMKQAIWESGDRKTEEQAEIFIRELSPIMWEAYPDPETGKYFRRLREIKDLSDSEFVEHIDFLKQLAAENFGMYVEDPRVL